MVQFFQGREDPRNAQYGQLASSLGQGLGNGLNSYFANKALEEAATNPENKNLPLSERFGKLQQAAAPYGPAGQKFANQRMQYMEQEHNRGLLQTALSDVSNIVDEGGSNLDVALAFTKAGAGIPGFERAAGQVLPMILQQANAQRLHKEQNQQNQNAPPQQQTQQNAPQQSSINQNAPQPQKAPQAPRASQPTFASELTPSPQQPSNYGVKTPEDMIENAHKAARETGDPAQFERTLSNDLIANKLFQDRKDTLKTMGAEIGGVTPEEMPYFTDIGDTVPFQNEQQWFQDTMNKWAPVKDDYKKLNDAFIPGVGSALLGRNREEALKNIQPITQDLMKKGQERQARKFLTENYLSPTEVEEQIHPLTKNTKNALKSVPKGIFPAQTREEKTWSSIPKNILEQKFEKTPFSNYETVKEKSPKTLETMQNRLANFFLKNVDKNTSLSVLRQHLWKDKDYDWRQIGPAIEQARSLGLELTPTQTTELVDISTNPPLQSLPDMFRSWGRILDVIKGAK